MRNRNLAILSRSRLKMQSLAVGHVSTTSYGKPRITNQVKTLHLEITLHLYVAPSHISILHYLWKLDVISSSDLVA